MKKFTTTALLASVLIPAAAFAQINVGDNVGTTIEAVTAELEAKGYVINEVEKEWGEIEFEVTLDGVAYEIEVSEKTGMVTEIELEDDEDESDND